MITPTIFRGKRMDNSEWVEGDLMWHKRFSDTMPYIKLQQTGQIEWFQIQPDSIGKATGFVCTKGKKQFIGKLIFEGDVFREEDGESINYKVVMWIPQRAAFYMVDVDHYHVLQHNDCSKDLEFNWLFQDAALYDFSIDVGLPKVGTIHDKKFR